jgi:hypothetical protein
MSGKRGRCRPISSLTMERWRRRPLLRRCQRVAIRACRPGCVAPLGAGSLGQHARGRQVRVPDATVQIDGFVLGRRKPRCNGLQVPSGSTSTGRHATAWLPIPDFSLKAQSRDCLTSGNALPTFGTPYAARSTSAVTPVSSFWPGARFLQMILLVIPVRCVSCDWLCVR